MYIDSIAKRMLPLKSMSYLKRTRKCTRHPEIHSRWLQHEATTWLDDFVGLPVVRYCFERNHHVASLKINMGHVLAN